MISKTIGYNGVHYFQTHPDVDMLSALLKGTFFGFTMVWAFEWLEKPQVLNDFFSVSQAAFHVKFISVGDGHVSIWVCLKIVYP